MSKILFWSPLHGQGQTSNLHVCALIMNLLLHKSVVMMQTHFSKNNLEYPLVGQNIGKQSKGMKNLFLDIGLDVAVTYSNMEKLNLRMLESCCLSFPDTSLFLLPGTETKNKETFDRDIGKSIHRIIRDADECMDMVMIDSNSGDDELSLRLMSLADLIIINLTQRRYVLDKFFNDYGDEFLVNKKVFYLFGDYDDNSCCNINNCRRRYKKYINNSNSGVIPYCTQYMDAQNESDVLHFIRKGLQGSEGKDTEKLYHLLRKYLSREKYGKDDVDYFIQQSRLAVEKMFHLLKVTPTSY